MYILNPREPKGKREHHCPVYIVNNLVISQSCQPFQAYVTIIKLNPFIFCVKYKCSFFALIFLEYSNRAALGVWPGALQENKIINETREGCVIYFSLPAKARAWAVVTSPQQAGMTFCGGIHNLHGWVPPPQDLVHMHRQTGD